MESSQSSGSFYPSWEEVCADSSAGAEVQGNEEHIFAKRQRLLIGLNRIGLAVSALNYFSYSYSLGAGHEGSSSPAAVIVPALSAAGVVICGVGIRQANDALERLQAPE